LGLKTEDFETLDKMLRQAKVESLSTDVRLAHLARHNRLKDGQPKDSYLWIDPPIATRRARQVAARRRLILRANTRGLPYAFSPPNDRIALRYVNFFRIE
jgi:hypothetical protein